MNAILGQLEQVIDPCSVSAGAPLSIVQMGMLSGCTIDDQGRVEVRLRLSSPGCLMGGLMFAPDIEHRLSQLDGISAVEVELDDPHTWSEDAISPEGRARLAAVRADGRTRLQLALAGTDNTTSRSDRGLAEGANR